ncbi:hexapeptide repeat-containing transferase [Pseudopedobacter saltans DSM 12145]|uniref:Acetyltransferase n=1 Tax=Pseudopedobacter saltans (strain ATCC 51119 / DSM 12145 / JCM 21818 / CCUG 39354 / LMG 10337 / NBRC 100064 / NCIMB 13643) TaxID=762903 RepID=F0S9A8_PSESL|nr:sugar O-acetyltransferase [Pseudopedobacter saltans]ADY52458.1 hexapeptide repeat-containing transferase [Pseudopedobacter saltans DSM 12145]
MTEKEKMLAGLPYNAQDEILMKERRHAKRLLRQLNISEYLVTKTAKSIIRELIPNTSGKLYIEPPFHCDYGYNIYCGENVYFNVNCVLLDVCKIDIGNNVMFGPNVQIYTATHPLNFKERLEYELGKPISIGNNCWIGGNTTICPGVKIGNRSVIGAGSVVTKDIPEDCLAVGNPAKVIKTLNKSDLPADIYNNLL